MGLAGLNGDVQLKSRWSGRIRPVVTPECAAHAAVAATRSAPRYMGFTARRRTPPPPPPPPQPRRRRRVRMCVRERASACRSAGADTDTAQQGRSPCERRDDTAHSSAPCTRLHAACRVCVRVSAVRALVMVGAVRHTTHRLVCAVRPCVARRTQSAPCAAPCATQRTAWYVRCAPLRCTTHAIRAVRRTVHHTTHRLVRALRPALHATTCAVCAVCAPCAPHNAPLGTYAAPRHVRRHVRSLRAALCVYATCRTAWYVQCAPALHAATHAPFDQRGAPHNVRVIMYVVTL